MENQLRLLRAYADDRQYIKEYAHKNNTSVHELLRRLVSDLKQEKYKIGDD